MKIKIIFLIVALIILIIFWRVSSKEGFWDRGYSRQAYLGQPFTRYGRNAFIASTDDPKMLIDPCAVHENPPFCGACNSYNPDILYNHF